LDDSRLPRRLYMFLALLGLLMAAYYYPRMPLRMASHFAADGRPNGWQPRESFFLITLVVGSLSGIISFFAPLRIASQPNARINLPHRDYWLSPERRSQTMNYISSFMAWFGCAVLFVLISGTYLALQANLAPNGRFNSGAMLAVIVSFLLFLLLALLRFFRHFQKGAQKL
jgi:uncharacterized membrane protein